MNYERHETTTAEVDDDEAITNAQAIIDLVERLAQPSELQLEEDEQGRQRVVALPAGLTLKSLKPFADEYRTAPERRKGTSNHTTLDSFCAAVDRFKDANTVLFANDDPRSPSLTAVFDYHEANRVVGDGGDEDLEEVVIEPGAPRFGQHRAHYAFPLSEEWLAWTRLPESMSQRAFAEFLEEHIGDVLDVAEVPDRIRATASRLGLVLEAPSTLLTLARELSITVERKITNAQNLSSGEAQITYEETHKSKDGSGPIRVPGGFATSIPVFRGVTEGFVSIARLRYRVKGGDITWRVILHQVDKSFRTAFTEACELAQKRTGAPLFFGSPEESSK